MRSHLTHEPSLGPKVGRKHKTCADAACQAQKVLKSARPSARYTHVTQPHYPAAVHLLMGEQAHVNCPKHQPMHWTPPRQQRSKQMVTQRCVAASNSSTGVSKSRVRVTTLQTQQCLHMLPAAPLVYTEGLQGARLPAADQRGTCQGPTQQLLRTKGGTFRTTNTSLAADPRHPMDELGSCCVHQHDSSFESSHTRQLLLKSAGQQQCLQSSWLQQL